MTGDNECILVSDNLSLEQLKGLIRDVAPQYCFVRVYLFGSRARGDYRSDSDYDFCVVPSTGCTLFDLGGFLMDMEEVLGSDVNVVSERGLKKSFLESIESERRVVYEA